MELWFGLIFPIINGVFMLILCPLVFWRWLSQEKRCTTLEKGFTSAREEAKKSAEALWEMRERCRKNLVRLYDEISWLFRTSSPEQFHNRSHAVYFLLDQVGAIWDIYQRVDAKSTLIPKWSIDFVVNLGLITDSSSTSRITTGCLATWRTEIAAAQVYLLQLDGRGRMGRGGGRRNFEDSEIRELIPLKGGMRWIIERVITGNCPFPFGPDIIHELEELIARIEALESALT